MDNEYDEVLEALEEACLKSLRENEDLVRLVVANIPLDWHYCSDTFLRKATLVTIAYAYIYDTYLEPEDKV